MSWTDRSLGIVLGVLLGVGIVALFVFEFSEETIDEAGLAEQAESTEGGAGAGGGAAADTVRVVGGLPPESGPAQLAYEQGDQARIRVISDGAVTLELQGYGITRAIPAGQPTVIEFEASRTGNFALLSGSIGVAQIRVTRGL
jgi:hypothetical protein